MVGSSYAFTRPVRGLTGLLQSIPSSMFGVGRHAGVRSFCFLRCRSTAFEPSYPCMRLTSGIFAVIRLFPTRGAAADGQVCSGRLGGRSTAFGSISPHTRRSVGFTGKICVSPMLSPTVSVPCHSPLPLPLQFFFLPCSSGFSYVFWACFVSRLQSARVLGCFSWAWVCGFFFFRVVRVFLWALGGLMGWGALGAVGCLLGVLTFNCFLGLLWVLCCGFLSLFGLFGFCFVG